MSNSLRKPTPTPHSFHTMSPRHRDARQRHRSGFDRLPSPKKSRRDGKPEAEREESGNVSDGGDSKRRRLQDALPLQDSAAVIDNKTDPTDVPRSRSYFQHDERGNARQVRRGFDRRATDEEHRGKDSNRDGLAVSKKHGTDDLGRQEVQAKADNRDVWKHDGFFKMEAGPAQPVRKRPAFREKKMPLESEDVDKATTKPVRPGHSDYPISGSDRRQERDRNHHRLDRYGRFAPEDGIEAQKRGVSSRERYAAGNNNQRGRERFNGKQGYHVSDQRGGKWKHDLFDEDDKSLSRKNEDDQIANVEALLASLA